jgi:phosphatidyl-myo-inositol alpha-mannosyltransferase
MMCPYSLSRPGGVQGQVAGLARSLRALGHQVAVLAPDDERPIGRVPDPDHASGSASGGRRVTDFDGTHVLGRSVRLQSNGSVAPVSISPTAAARAERFVGRHHPDVVHIHEPMAPAVGYGCLVRHRAPLVGTYHRSGDSGWYRMLRPVARWANNRLDARCAVSEAACETARAALGGTYEVLFNGVEVARFSAAEPWPTDRPTVLFLGRHEGRKGLGVLLESFAEVPDPVVLWVAGDGPDTDGLRRQYPESERVRWLGLLDEEEVAGRLAGADVLCAPSLLGESFGMVLLEAMAAGCAVVASDLPGYRAAAAGHAVLVPPGEVAALGKALTETVAAAVGGVGRSSPRSLLVALQHAEGWSMDTLADRYVDVYSEAIEVWGAAGQGRVI